MSHTTLMGVLEDGTIEQIAEYDNSWGAGPYVWRILFEVRRGVRAFQYPKKGYMEEGAGYISSRFMPQCTEEEAWVLALTFDSAIVSRESAPVAAKHLRSFLDGPGHQRGVANHWPAILKVLENMPEQYEGITISQTSVEDSVLLHGVQDDEDEFVPYNTNVHTMHFFLTAERIRAWREK